MSETAAEQPPAIAGLSISMTGLVKKYGERSVLDGVDLTIQPGETAALIGPSGGGKSTLLRCINGLNTFDAGEVRVGPHVLSPNGSRGTGVELGTIRRLVGMIFQDFQLFPHLTALGNVVEAPIQVMKRSRKEAEERGRELLHRVGLGERCDYFPRQLSGGQKQRVAIARALAMEPKALLCDEITSALDPELKHEVLDVLEALRRDGMTIIMVTHEIGFARKAADRVVVLAGGKIVDNGPASKVIDNPTTPRTQQFLSRVLG